MPDRDLPEPPPLRVFVPSPPSPRDEEAEVDLADVYDPPTPRPVPPAGG